MFSPFSRFRRFRVFVLGVFAFSRFRVPPAAPPRPGHRFRVHRSFDAVLVRLGTRHSLPLQGGSIENRWSFA